MNITKYSIQISLIFWGYSTNVRLHKTKLHPPIIVLPLCTLIMKKNVLL